jgi:hypothetical protein
MHSRRVFAILLSGGTERKKVPGASWPGRLTVAAVSLASHSVLTGRSPV